jgi:hypothetical protein
MQTHHGSSIEKRKVGILKALQCVDPIGESTLEREDIRVGKGPSYFCKFVALVTNTLTIVVAY